MSKRRGKSDYWQDAPMARHQMVLIPTALEDLIPQAHPVRLLDEILDRLTGRRGNPVTRDEKVSLLFIPAFWPRFFCGA